MELSRPTWTTDVAGRPEKVLVRRCRLEVVDGPDRPLRYEFESGHVRVGARPIAGLVLSDGRVSALHCDITLDDGGYRLRDLGSKNGTFVSGMRINDAYLEPGAAIRIGNTTLQFHPLHDVAEVALSRSGQFEALIGQSTAMRRLFAQLERVAPSDATVLISGETGTGKELVADALHRRSLRAAGPFVVFDCGSVSGSLFDRELFGHERGAFTGATARAPGLAECAHRGTLLLDEIGELPLELQPKLLRFIEQKEVRRIGSTQPLPVDVRIVAATHRDLAVEVSRGRFREDLYHRLAVVSLRVPALRERREDIPLLAAHFAAEIGGEAAAPLRPEIAESLARRDWLGNVRELRNAVERAIVFAGDEDGLANVVAPGESFEVTIDLKSPYTRAKRNVLDQFERRFFENLLEVHGGNVTAAARAASVDRMTIHKAIRRLTIRPTRSRMG